MIETVNDLLKALYQNGKRQDIVSVECFASAKEASLTMAREKVNLLAVRKKGKFVGVVTSTDTSREFGSSGTSLRPSERLVSEVMTAEIITARLGDKIMELPLKFKNIRHLIVVNGRGKWIAVLDSNEVMNAIVANINESENCEAQIRGELHRND